MTLREWILCRQAHARRDRADWRRTLALVNVVSQIAGGDTIELGDLYDAGRARQSDREAYEAFKGRHIDWILQQQADA